MKSITLKTNGIKSQNSLLPKNNYILLLPVILRLFPPIVLGMMGRFILVYVLLQFFKRPPLSNITLASWIVHTGTIFIIVIATCYIQ